MKIFDFANEWCPKSYLDEFYQKIQDDEIETIAFLSHIARYYCPRDAILLEFGSGPTVHHIFPFIPFVSEVHVVDLLDANLEEVSRWTKGEHGAHNWDEFVRYTLQCEGGMEVTSAEINARKQETRDKITRLMIGDASKEVPTKLEDRGLYPIVLSCYCADSATECEETFQIFLQNIFSLVATGGVFVICCLQNAKTYRVGKRQFPSASVDEESLTAILKCFADPETVVVQAREVDSHSQQGYTGILLGYCKKSSQS